VARASAIKQTQREKKDRAAPKPRGAKHRKQQQANFLKLTPEESK
jgi:hypothetical protein